MPRPDPTTSPSPRKIRVRHAEPADCADVAPLLCVPQPGLVELMGSPGDARRAARALFASAGTLESYRHTWVAEAIDGLVAAAVAIPGEEVAASRLRTGLTVIAAAPWRLGWVVGRGRILDRLTAPVPHSAMFLVCLAVRDDSRGLGIGRMLIQTVVAAVAHEGRRRVCLDVGIDERQARRFYDRLGFHETSRFPTSASEHARIQSKGLIRLEKTLRGLDAEPGEFRRRPA